MSSLQYRNMKKDNSHADKNRRKETEKGKKEDIKTFGHMEKVEKEKEKMYTSVQKHEERQQ